jgi:hypothetical protein
MKTIISLCLLFVLICLAGNNLAGAEGHPGPQDRVITIHSMARQGGHGQLTELSLQQLESLGSQRIASSYFDRAMDYQGSRFTAISFARLLDRFDPDRLSDAVLLKCVDDYQGILPVEDIRRYDLQLATRIEVKADLKVPSWLNPLLVLVPEGVSAPFQEKFMTANIRELEFINQADYYAPLQDIVGKFPGLEKGFQSYKNNCQFCHSLKKVGGNKGGRLIKKYRFSMESERQRFLSDFAGFHNKQNADKQNVEQFVTDEEIEAVGKFLAVFAK